MKPRKIIASPAAQPARKHRAVHPAIISVFLALLTWAIFHPVGGHDYINLDDPNYVAANPNVQAGLTPASVAWAFQTTRAGYWQPMTWLSHMVDVELFGRGPAGPHLMNVAIHIANTLLLFFILQNLTGALWRPAFVAALFAWHPLRVESVAWVQERRDMLSGLFFLLTLWAYANYVRATRAGGAAHPTRHYVLALTCFALGLTSKPILVTLPFVLLLLDFWPLARFQPGTLPRLLREKIPFLVITLVFCAVTVFTQAQGGAVQSLSNCPLDVRLENALVSYVRYLGKIFWPVQLATPYSDIQAWPVAVYGGAAALLLALTAGAVWCRRKFPFVTLGWFWFVGILVPVIGIVQAGSQSMADRFTYLPLIGVFVAVAWGGAALLARWRVPAVGGGILAVLVLVAYAARTRDQLPYWRDSETLFRHTLAVTRNNWVAHGDLGEALDHQGRLDEALQHYRRAVEIQPGNAECLNNLAHALVRTGQYAGAVPLFERALQAKPGFAEVHYNLAYALRNLGHYGDAIAHYQLYLHAESGPVTPVTIAAWKELGVTLGVIGRADQAAACLQEALRLQPDDADTHFNLALTLVNLGMVTEAREHFSEAARLRPGWSPPQNELAALDLDEDWY